MRFHVTDDRSGLRKTYYYDFSEMEVVGEPTDDDRSQLAVRARAPRLCCPSTVVDMVCGCS